VPKAGAPSMGLCSLRGAHNKPADVAPAMPSRSAKACSDSTRPVTSSSNHARPRAIALISAGSPSRAVVWLIQSRQHQLGFDTAPLKGDCCRQLNSTTARVLQCG